jgi:hypothetical protein
MDIVNHEDTERPKNKDERHFYLRDKEINNISTFFVFFATPWSYRAPPCGDQGEGPRAFSKVHTLRGRGIASGLIEAATVAVVLIQPLVEMQAFEHELDSSSSGLGMVW